jgi:cysteine synthase
MARTQGVLIGPSSGGAIAGALRYADSFNKNDCVVTLLCDSGRNYVSKNFFA